MALTPGDIRRTSDIIKAQLQSSTSESPEWRKPIKLFGSNEDETIQRTYQKLCHISDEEWSKSSKVVSEILQLFSKTIKDKMSRASEKYNGIMLDDFLPLGSSREGLKVKSPDEFDVLMPFNFHGQNTSASLSTLPGHAEIYFTGAPNEWANKYGLVRDGVGVVRSRNIHERYFRGLIEAATSTIRDLIKKERQEGIVFNITTTTNPPAITLHITVNYENQEQLMGYFFTVHSESRRRETFTVDVDLVPGVLLNFATNGKRYIVTRWFHEGQENNPRLQDHLDTLWRISYSDFEIKIMDMCRTGSSSQQYIITAARIIKGLQKRRAEVDPSDQFPSVIKSYYLKTILLFTLLYFTKINKIRSLSNVTEAFTCYVEMFRRCLAQKKLPHFFLANPNLSKLYPVPQYQGEDRRMNLFEGIEMSLPSVSRSLRLALSEADIVIRDDIIRTYAGVFDAFEAHICQ